MTSHSSQNLSLMVSGNNAVFIPGSTLTTLVSVKTFSCVLIICIAYEVHQRLAEDRRTIHVVPSTEYAKCLALIS